MVSARIADEDKAVPGWDNDLAWTMWETYQHIHRSFNEALKPHGITSTQLSMLIRIAREPGLSGADLARLSLTTTQAANLALTALERKKLVERTPAEGARHILQTVLTETGHAVLRSSVEAVRELERSRQKKMTDAERTQLRALLRKYGGAPDDTSPDRISTAGGSSDGNALPDVK